MTPKEIATALDALKRKVGPRAYISIGLTSDHDKVRASVYPDGVTFSANSIWIEPQETFEEAIAALDAAWAERAAKFHADTVRKIALEIISLTYLNGDCTRAGLRMKFSDAEIDLLGADAIAVAATMAEGGPFSIKSTPSNGAPEDDGNVVSLAA